VTTQYLGRAIIGVILPDYGDIDGVPEPYRSTAMQSRALLKQLKGSQPVEPGEVVTPPISEEPTP